MKDLPRENGASKPVRLIVAEASEQAVRQFDSVLRDAGIATRMQLVDLSLAAESLDDADLMLCNAALPQLDRILPQLRRNAPDVPIILVDHRPHGMKVAEGARLGAVDVVPGDDPEHLVLVFRRELEHVCRTRSVVALRDALREAEQRCELLLQTTQAAIAYVHEGMHIHANDAYLGLFGFADADEVLGLPLIDLMTGQSVDCLKAELKRFRRSADADKQQLPFTGRARNGAEVRGQLTLSAAQYEGEHCIQVTVRAAAAPPAERRPVTADPATEPGRAETHANGAAGPQDTDHADALNHFLSEAAAHLQGLGPWRALLVVQIDQFDKLQAERGLRNGKRIAAAIRTALTEALPQAPVVALAAHRFAMAAGGDTRSAVLKLAQGLVESIAAHRITIDDQRLTTTISIGGAIVEGADGAVEPGRLETALDGAYSAALRVAEGGGNGAELQGGALAAGETDSATGRLLAAINEAIENESFVLQFQPIISLRGDASEHYEVFLRMVDDSGAEIRPQGFLGTAIEHGVAGKIDRWVILRAIKLLMAHRAEGHDTRLTINLTANSMTDPDFPNWLGVALKAARLPSDAVIFQVTEPDVTAMVRQAQVFVQALRAMHCQTSLSRFGTSEESLERLRLLPVDYVKLDGSLIHAIGADPANREPVVKMLSALQSHGKLSIVPMVETAGILSTLWQAGANFVQGNYLQEPTAEMNFDFSTAD